MVARGYARHARQRPGLGQPSPSPEGERTRFKIAGIAEWRQSPPGRSYAPLARRQARIIDAPLGGMRAIARYPRCSLDEQFHDLLHGARLEQVVIDTRRGRTASIRLHAVRGDGDDQDAVELPRRLEPGRHLEAIEVRHPDVEEYDLGPRRQRDREAIGARSGHLDLMAPEP